VLPQPPEGLRHWRLADAPALAVAWADERVRLWNPPPADADATSWIMRCDERWALRLSIDFVIDVDGSVGGEVGLRNFTTDPDRAELGVWVGEQHRGQGLAARSVRSVADWAHAELALDQLWARTAPANEPARALFESAGWTALGEQSAMVVWSHTPT
jgi:RimJ/RimL family protein N-acetyltransferase